MQLETVNLVARKLRTDVHKLEPFRWDTEEEKRRKWTLIQHDEDERRELWNDAITKTSAENSIQEVPRSSEETDTNSNEHGGSRIQMRENEPFRQLMQIHDTGKW